MDISERNLEDTIEQVLLSNGPDAYPQEPGQVRQLAPVYHLAPGDFAWGSVARGGYCKRKSVDYDKTLCLLPNDVLAFIYATQPREWEKFKRQYGNDARAKFFQRLNSELQKRGTLGVLRKGIKANGCKFQLAYFRPSSGLNQALQKLYEANLFSVVRQLRYSEKNANSLDIVLFLNGLPLFTAELKNHFTGQTVEDAIKQYKQDRDPREPLFAFGRCLAHFAVDPELVYMTSHLQGDKTRFLPFNQGRNFGAGNPPSWQGFATAYLWERIWARDSVLDLVQHFVQVVEEEDANGKKTGKKSLIFPRYHQLDAVRRLVTEARAKGPGQCYLVEHSAGSGKSNSISWLAHQLSVLHDAQDKRVFDSIIVITDRKVLDKQLQRTVHQFEQTVGVVENIDTTSSQLKEALERGKTIIVTTLQKFPVIVGQIGALPGKRFAVIVDEAHSSQSGESTKSLKSILRVGDLDETDVEEGYEEDDMEDRIAEEMKKRGKLPNVSFFAFTATPKPKTLELFGVRCPDGRYEAFSLYTMRQAIEEHFILDVLENYTTYKTYWSLLKRIETDPRYDRTKATLLLKSFVDRHEQTIARKVNIMIEHFVGQVAHRIGGKAKAMIVTRSRLHAVRYKHAVDRYLQEKGYPYKALVAFSGEVEDGALKYSEAGMNHIPEAQTAKTFEQDDHRFLIVANKFQTGFDQPLLHTMYVDKKLGGVNAVQTLSRLNRIDPGKNETMVLDFANSAEEIQEAFKPYYEKTLLTEGTDPNLLYDRQNQLLDFHLYTDTDVNSFARLYYDDKASQDKLYAALDSIVERYKEITEEEKADFRSQLTDYLRLYAFLSQIISFIDTDMEKLYVFGRLLLRRLPLSKERLPVEIQQNIDIESYRVKKTSSGKITLPRGQQELEPIRPQVSYNLATEELEALSQIIQELNQHFGTDFGEEDKLCIRELEERLVGNTSLEKSVLVNPPEHARLTFDHVIDDLLQDMIEGHFKFYKQVNDDEEFARMFKDWLFKRYLNRARDVQ